MSECERSRNAMRSREAPADASPDDAADSPNNSLIEKVKSRVSSILPNRLSRWFGSPLARPNEALNGTVAAAADAVPARRRRRRHHFANDADADAADDSYEDFEDDGAVPPPAVGAELEPPPYNVFRGGQRRRPAEPLLDETPASSDEESNNSEGNEDLSRSRRILPPPPKRTRLNFEVSNVSQQPLVASTPAMGGHRAQNHYSPGPPAARAAPYDFGHCAASAVPAFNHNDALNSRRTLNVPWTSASRAAVADPFCFEAASNRRRPTTHGQEYPTTSAGVAAPCPAASLFDGEANVAAMAAEETLRRKLADRMAASNYNGKTNTSNNNNNNDVTLGGNKRHKLMNGGGGVGGVGSPHDPLNLGDSASEADSDRRSAAGHGNQRRAASEVGGGSGGGARRLAGLFNASPPGRKNRGGGRTSSMGNGLNFFTHLDGQKSLFAGGGSQMNDSTMSLTSLNRRQFNASIYGSTSALSDSRLLQQNGKNAFSPFYEGRTTFCGANAYNKYALKGTRLTPTLIRPTSSLSTLSSSSNSLAPPAPPQAPNPTTTAGVDGNSAISSTAKRILELINDFATPLSEAKKMATTPRLQMTSAGTSPGQRPRFTEHDLHASRATRLTQLSSPYARPTVMLQPKPGRTSIHAGGLPPIRELQVPSMSQLLQMKRLQSSTERSRRITSANAQKAPITTTAASGAAPPAAGPSAVDADTLDNGAAQRQKSSPLPPKSESPQQQRHTNKMRTKVSQTSRAQMAPNDEAPPAPLDLPHIAFPAMQAVPKIDIAIPAVATASVGASATTAKPLAKASTRAEVPPKTTASPPKFAFNKTTPTAAVARSLATPTPTTSGGFQFAAPLQLRESAADIVTTPPQNFKFSPPTLVQTAAADKTDAAPKPVARREPPAPTPLPAAAPPLKKGSVLDALKKTASPPAEVPVAAPAASFGTQFRKAANEWECDACMLRNKNSAAKCVACETPRPGATTASTASAIAAPSSSTTPSLPPLKNSFGDAFKPKGDTWECPTCLIQNKGASLACVACETKKPGAAVTSSAAPAPMSNFKFGFASPATTAPAATSSGASTDAGFKTLVAAQKAKKWECEACMTRNDETRSKCVCCEQAKPGAQDTPTDNGGPKFAFGTTSAAKYSFGFGGATKEGATSATTTAAASSEPPKTFGFTFGAPAAAAAKPATDDVSTSSGVGVSFGFKPTPAPAAAATAASGSPSPFKFGAVTASETPASTASPLKGFTFGKPSVVPAAEASTSAASSTLVSTTSTSAAGVKLALPAATTTTTEKESVALPSLGGTKFGASGVTQTKPDSVTSSAGGFAFKPAAPVVSTTAAASTTTTTTTNAAPSVAGAKPMFSFGGAATTTTTKTPAATGGFSFGSSTAATTTIAPVSKPLFGAPSSTTSAATGVAAPSTSLFGSFGGSAADSSVATSTSTAASNSAAAVTSTTATTSAPPTFGSFGGSSGGGSAAPTSSNIFGSFAAAQSTSSSASAAPTPAAAPPAWPKTNAFSFGASAAPAAEKAAPATTFGNFGAPSIAPASSSLFGGVQTTSTAAPAAAVSSFGGNAFGASAAPIAGSSGAAATNVFGSLSGPAAAPGVGGGNNVGTSAPPAFGGATFGGFGGAPTPAAPGGPSGSDGGPSAKRTQLAFNFSAPSQTTSGGFNFGSGNGAGGASKPAFNFGGPAQTASFNFTGAAEAAPPNAPFQFNAGSAPAANNIFAPTAGLGATASGAQQVRRKIRTPMRRLTPR